MALRTSETAVREILDTSLTTQQVLAFITDANVWVTEEIASWAGITASRLEIIERYLACALIRIKDAGLASGTIGDIAETYQVDPQVTDYLLRAASFDPSGAIRTNFLAPKPVALPSPIIIPVKLKVGTGFADESSV